MSGANRSHLTDLQDDMKAAQAGSPVHMVVMAALALLETMADSRVAAGSVR